jgi:hypothetical protein
MQSNAKRVRSVKMLNAWDDCTAWAWVNVAPGAWAWRPINVCIG